MHVLLMDKSCLTIKSKANKSVELFSIKLRIVFLMEVNYILGMKLIVTDRRFNKMEKLLKVVS